MPLWYVSAVLGLKNLSHSKSLTSNRRKFEEIKIGNTNYMRYAVYYYKEAFLLMKTTDLIFSKKQREYEFSVLA